MNRASLTRLSLILALLAVFARAMIPAGYMPSFGDRDTVKIVICTIEGSKTISVDGKFNPVNGDTRHKKPSLCDFSLVKNLSLQTPALAIFSVLLLLSFLSFRILQTPVRRLKFRDSVIQPRAPPLSI